MNRISLPGLISCCCDKVLSDLNTLRNIFSSTLCIFVFKKGHLGFFLFFLIPFEYLKPSPNNLTTLDFMVLWILINNL